MFFRFPLISIFVVTASAASDFKHAFDFESFFPKNCKTLDIEVECTFCNSSSQTFLLARKNGFETRAFFVAENTTSPKPEITLPESSISGAGASDSLTTTSAKPPKATEKTGAAEPTSEKLFNETEKAGLGAAEATSEKPLTETDKTGAAGATSEKPPNEDKKGLDATGDKSEKPPTETEKAGAAEATSEETVKETEKSGAAEATSEKPPKENEKAGAAGASSFSTSEKPPKETEKTGPATVNDDHAEAEAQSNSKEIVYKSKPANVLLVVFLCLLAVVCAFILINAIMKKISVHSQSGTYHVTEQANNPI